jgi:cyclopropane fatty-acyl-phospholipid synthase-like methyltransferase
VPDTPAVIDARSIVRYYDAAELDYRLTWRLGSQMAMHFGYWDTSTKTLAAALQRENQLLAEWAGIRGSDTVLDAGCGVGGSAIYLGRTIGCRVLGITLSPAQVRTATRNAARSKVSELTRFEQRDFLATGLPDASFDVVWAIESVCHAETKLNFLREAFRILRPGGRLILADGFALKDSLTPAEAAVMRRWLDGWAVPSIDSVEQFRSNIRAAGFHLAREQDATENVVPSSRRLYRLAHLRFFGYALYALHLRSKAAHGNAIAARNQYLALTQGLCGYHIFLGVKP